MIRSACAYIQFALASSKYMYMLLMVPLLLQTYYLWYVCPDIVIVHSLYVCVYMYACVYHVDLIHQGLLVCPFYLYNYAMVL